MVGISHVHYVLGDYKPLTEIPEMDTSKENLAKFRINGVRQYCGSDKTMYQLALETATATLEKSGLDKSSVGAVFFATGNHHCKELHEEDFAGRLLDELGLGSAFFYGVFMQYCASVAAALQLAAQFAEANGTNVLLVSADKILDYGPIVRIIPGVIGLHSDGAVSCIVTDRNPQFTMTPFQTLQDSSSWRLMYGQEKKGLQDSFLTNSRLVISRVLEANNLPKESIHHVVTNNFNFTISKNLSVYWEIPYEKFFSLNIPRTAHCPAGDVFINLLDMNTAGIISRGDSILTFFPAPHSWMGTLLTKN
ncbi:3-oxoacyl-ACP synthase [Paenibacillus chitinolyticus]|uniref:3-oxoacyl-ACP synthase n=1 Tax=Paenibacillus chitinolyticus TaxID=79263 RepID=UPI003557C550